MHHQPPKMNLPEQLRASILTSEGKEPILHHLNADSSWLFQIPYPASVGVTHRDPHARKFFNILIDPWLSGAQSDVASWFSKQWHAIPPHHGSIASVELLCREVEHLLSASAEAKVDESQRFIDAVAISHEFTDHCHEETMKGLHPGTNVFANDVSIFLPSHTIVEH
jgi:hypothetical protein